MNASRVEEVFLLVVEAPESRRAALIEECVLASCTAREIPGTCGSTL